MNKILIALLFATVVFASTVTDSTIDEEPVFAEMQGRGSNDACDIQLIKNFRKFEFKHELKHVNKSKNGVVQNWVWTEMTVAPPKSYSKTCYNTFGTKMAYKYNGKYYDIAANNDMDYMVNRNSFKRHSFELKDLGKVSLSKVKIHKGVKYNVVQYMVTLLNEKKQRIRTHVFRHWISIDHAWGEFNPDETGDEYKIVKTRIYHTDDDCDGEDCILKINLTTKLICYKDSNYRNRITGSTKLWISQFIYCELSFTDPNIKKFLNLVSVVIKGDGKDNEIIRSGWYTKGKQFRGKSRFRVLVYWPEMKIIVKANARVTHTIQNCKKHCVECDKDSCDACVRGLMPQGLECVARCGKGYFQKGAMCKPCERHCMKCKSGTDCDVCIVPRYLYNNNCVTTCPKPLVPKNGVCVNPPEPFKKYYGKIFKNLNRNKFISGGFTTVYDYNFGYAMRKTHFDNIRNRCDANDWIAVLACDDKNVNHVIVGAIDNCRFALTLRTYKQRQWHTIYRRKDSCVYWFNAHELCFGFSRYNRAHFHECHAVHMSYLPEFQVHINYWGYAVGKEINNSNRKVFMIKKK